MKQRVALVLGGLLLASPVSAVSYDFQDTDNIWYRLNGTKDHVSYTGVFDLTTSDADGFSGFGPTSTVGYDPSTSKIVSAKARFTFTSMNSLAPGVEVAVSWDTDIFSLGSSLLTPYAIEGGIGSLLFKLGDNGKLNYSVQWKMGDFQFDQAILTATASPIPDVAATGLLLGIGFGGLVMLRKKTKGPE